MAKTVVITELAPATSPTATPAAGGSLAASTTYYYKIVAVEFTSTTVRCSNAAAYSVPTAEISATTDATNKTINLAWTAPAKIKAGNTLAYLIFRTTTSGDYSNSVARFIQATTGDSGYATTVASATSFSDAGTNTMNTAFLFTAGVPMVEIDGGTSGDKIDEEYIYQAYVTAGKTAFASRTSLTYGAGHQYAFKGMWRVGFLTQCYWQINSGRDITLEGKIGQNTNTFFYMGASSGTGDGATFGIAGVNSDTTSGFAGTFAIYNSKIYGIPTAQGMAISGSFWNLNMDSFNLFRGDGASVMVNSQLYMFGANAQISENTTLTNCVVGMFARIEGATYMPTIRNTVIRGYYLYTYAMPYVKTQGITMQVASGFKELLFHGGSATDYRNIDLIDFTPTNSPIQGGAISNAAATWYWRRWSFNAIITNSANAVLSGVTIGNWRSDGLSESWIDSGAVVTGTGTRVQTTVAVSDGTKVPNGSTIKLACEHMLVTGVAGNTLTVTRGVNGTYANKWEQATGKIWIWQTALTTDANGTIPEQYMLQETYQGNSSKASPYQYDTVSYTPHKTTMRKYGYIQQSYSKTVNRLQNLQIALLTNAYVVKSEAAASAITGITVNGATSTITITATTTLHDLYDYTQWWAAQSANIQYAEPITTTDGSTYTSAYNIVLNGGDLTGGGSVTMASGKTFTKTSGAYDGVIINADGTRQVHLLLTGIMAGSRVQLYDTTASTELYNGVPGTTEDYIYTYSGSDHTVRIRVAQPGYLFIEATATAGSTGFSYTVAQVADDVYTTNGIDGSTVTEFSVTGTTIEAFINDPDNTTSIQRLYNWWCYMLSTATGIADQGNYVRATDTTNYRMYTGLKLYNSKTNPLVLTGGYFVPSTGGTPIDCYDTAGGPIFMGYPHVVGFSYASGSALTTAEHNQLMAGLTVGKFIALK